MSHTELHFHLLPGVDDGPASMRDTIELARAAAAEGTRTIVTTPHIRESFVTEVESLPDRVQAVNDALRDEAVPIDVLCGGELAHTMVSRLGDRELQVIAQGPPARRWLLLEAPIEGLDADFAAAAADLRRRGFAAVIAHPERALPSSPTGWRIIEDELAAGSALQVNGWSVAGVYGDDVRSQALLALTIAPIVVLASDAHGSSRPPSLRVALKSLAELGVAFPERFTTALPALLLRQGIFSPTIVPA